MNLIQADKILFIDIETISCEAKLENLNEPMRDFWGKKYESQKRRDPIRYESISVEDSYKSEAAIFAEFGKIVCISVGMVTLQVGIKHFRVKSYYGHDEKTLLLSFSKMLESFQAKSDFNLCGHNIKEFDIPYIARRMLINGINIPSIINIAGKKPWEVKFIDTLELWKFGDYKNYTSLALLTALFNIPTPKDDIEGSQVGRVYYEDGDIDRISKYCEKDVIATAQLYFKMNYESLIDEQNIEHIE